MQDLLPDLSRKDLLGVGVAAILGSGGFNMLGKAINRGGAQYPIALGAIGLLFMGASRVYDKAFQIHPSNIAESQIVEDQLGSTASRFSEGGILLFNIFSVATILVFCTQTALPNANWLVQIAVALIFLGGMYIFSLHGITENKKVTNIFSAGLIIFLAVLATAGLGDGLQNGFKSNLGAAPNLPLSILYFYFILAGFDSLIKFTQETKDKSDVPKSFYGANAMSIILVAGISLAFTHLTSKIRIRDENNAVGEIVRSIIGGKYTTHIVMFLSIICMIISTFICFLTSSRFLHGLGEKFKWNWVTEVNAVKAPKNAILLTFLVAAATIFINHLDWLVRFCDVFLTVTLILVSAAVTKKEWVAGRMPWIEGGTLLGFIALMGMIVWPGVRTE
jgi:hypothetical protein